ncbi:MAG: YlbF family regulator [Candidatus Izimaplasma sp.]|nr:YlbF family regulator [Candidatus Izimaplasma bacterium]
MKELDKLIEKITDQPKVKRFKQLEKIIDQNDELMQEYKKLLNLQKQLVQKKHQKTSNVNSLQKTYDAQKKRVETYPLISEYLDLLDEINNDLDLIQSIITEEINA